MLIGLCGHVGVGKDEVAKILVRNHGFRRIAFADKLREALFAIDPFVPWKHWLLTRHVRLSVLIKQYGWDCVKRRSTHVRELLQRVGTEAGRDIHGSDCWVTASGIRSIAKGENVVVSDVRFPNEVEAIESLGGVLVCVQRPGACRINNHRSEGLDYETVAKHLLMNNGSLYDLESNVELMLGVMRTQLLVEHLH